MFPIRIAKVKKNDEPQHGPNPRTSGRSADRLRTGLRGVAVALVTLPRKRQFATAV